MAGEFDRPVILFSGGKDSILVLHLARKAFYPAALPFALLHVDTGHNFAEVLDYRDRVAAEGNLRLHVAHVQDWLDDGRLTERPDGTRNPLQTVPLLDSINELGFDAVIGGARRDEERSRAKERIFSLRDAFGGWDPRRQRPELWDLYNGRHAPGEHVRVFPLSNWTELDVWRYIEREQIDLPRSTSPTSVRCSPAAACGSPPGALGRAQGGRADRPPAGPLPHRRGHVLHRGGRFAPRPTSPP